MIGRAVTSALVALAFAGCASTERAQETAPAPLTRHYVVYEKLTGERGVWIADVDGSKPRLVVPGGSLPSISPNGKWVAYAPYCTDSAADCDETYIISTEPGARARAVMDGVGWPITWSPDSKRIATVVWRDPRVLDELRTANVESGKQATLAHGQFWGWSISPDGTKIVYALEHGPSPKNFAGQKIDLYVDDLDGAGDPKAITETGDSGYPAWGPKSIAFSKLIPYEGFGRSEIWRIQPDGTGRSPITDSSWKRFAGWHCIGLEPIDWSPDGSALLASWECEGLGESVAVDPQTGATRSLGQASRTVSLSQNGQFALTQWGDERVGQKRQAILIYPYAGGSPKAVTRGASDPSWNR